MDLVLNFVENFTRVLKTFYISNFRAFLRIANAYFKQEKYEEAKIYYDKSLVEKRSPEALKKSQEVLDLNI